jgi:hypothetical protein
MYRQKYRQKQALNLGISTNPRRRGTDDLCFNNYLSTSAQSRNALLAGHSCMRLDLDEEY